MNNPFALQVTPELMQRLVDQGEKKPKRRRQAKQQPKPFSPISPLRQENAVEWHGPDVRRAPSAGRPARDAYFPPFGGSQPPFAGIFGASHSAETPTADPKKELAPIYQAIEESVNLCEQFIAESCLARKAAYFELAAQGVYSFSSPYPVRQDHMEQLAQRLQNQGDHELAKVQEMARDLQEKQYRAPSRAPPCSNERGNCIECYKENQKNPLLCSKLVQAFVTCSRQAQQAFAASVSS